MALKIKKNPDGSIELEGSVEEIDAYEKLHRGEVKEDKENKKKILLKENESNFDEEEIKRFIEQLQEWYEKVPVKNDEYNPWLNPWIYPDPGKPLDKFKTFSYGWFDINWCLNESKTI